MKKQFTRSMAIGLAGLTAINSIPGSILASAESGSHVRESENGSVEKDENFNEDGFSVTDGGFLSTAKISGNTCIKDDKMFYNNATMDFSGVLIDTEVPDEGNGDTSGEGGEESDSGEESGSGEGSENTGGSEGEDQGSDNTEKVTKETGDGSGESGSDENTGNGEEEVKDTLKEIKLVDRNEGVLESWNTNNVVSVSLSKVDIEGYLVLSSTYGKESRIAIKTYLTGLNVPVDMVEDTTTPVISLVSKEGEDKGNGYFVGDVAYKYTIEDSGVGLIDSVLVLVDGKKVESTYNQDTGELSFTAPIVEDGKHIVEVYAEDALKNRGSATDTIYQDTESPSLTLSNPEVGFVVGEVAYFKENTVLNYNVSDNVSGVKSVQLLKNGSEVVQENNGGSGNFAISESGEYSIKVADNIGNESVLSLKDLGLGANKVDFDKEAPALDVFVNGEEVSDDWYKDSARLSIRMSDNLQIDRYVVKVNGSENRSVEVNGKDASCDLNLESFAEKGIVSVSVEVYDEVGNVTTYSKDIRVDCKNPEFSNTRLDGDYSILGNTAYIKEPLTVIADAIDEESGVKSVELLKDGNVVSTEFPAKIEESGVYSLRVTDNVGHEVTISIGSISDDDITDIILDNKAPVIERKSGFTPDLVQDGKNWYRSIPNLVLEITDENIQDVKISVNGDTYIDGVHADNNYSITASGEDGVYTVDSSAMDKAGNILSDSFSYILDTKAPVLEKAELSGEFEDRGYGLYFKESPKVSVKYSDGEGVGIEKYILCNSEGSEIESNDTGVFTLSGGEYYLRVKDKLGNESALISLEDACGLSSNKIVIDSEKPVIECSRPSGDLNGWFADDVEYSAKITDTEGISSAYIEINGSKVATFTSGGSDSKEVSLKGNTSKIEESSDYHIRVYVEDNAGNRDVWVDYIHVDKNAPVISEGKLSDTWVDMDEVSYFKDSVDLSFKVSDSDIGDVRSVEMLKDGTKVTDLQENDGSYSYTIEEDGKYSVRVSDTLGNEKVYSISDIVSGVKGTVGFDRDGSSVSLKAKDGSEISDTWYKDSLDVVLSASDNKNIVKVEYSINGVNFQEEVNSKTFEKTISVSEAVNAKGICEIRVKVTDLVGNTTELTKEIKLDKVNPIISISSEKDFLVEGNVAYIKDPLKVKVSGSDLESGVKEVYVVGPDGLEKVSSEYIIDKSGSYALSIEDNVGHIVSKPLSDILGVQVDSIVYDEKAPEIERVSGFNPDLTENEDNWYSSYPEIIYNVNDDNLKSITVSVDGSEVLQKDTNGAIKVDYPRTNGKHTIRVESLDKAGSKSVDTYVFYVDTEVPSIGNGTIDKEYKNRGYGLYFQEKPTVVGGASDDGVGIEKYRLFNEDGDFLRDSKSFEFTLDSGSYYVSIVDKLGNESPRISIKSLCTLEDNRIVVDSEKAVITASRPDGDVDGWFSGTKVYDVAVRDKNGIYKATVDINGTVVDSFTAKEEKKSVSLKGDMAKVEAKEDGSYEIKVSVEDNAGNISEWFDKVYVDRVAPVISNGSVSDSPSDMEGVSYFKDSIELSFSVSDDDCGKVKSVEILKDGKSIKNFEDVQEYYKYLISEDGKYSVMVEDAVGNKKEYGLSTVVSGLSDRIGFDREVSLPKITLADGSEIEDKWYKDSLDVQLSVTDNKQIKKVDYSVNDKDFSEEVNAESYSKVIDVDENVNDKGIVTVNATSEDLVGHKSRVSKEIKLDKVFPELSVKTEDSYNLDEGVVYIRKPLNLSIDYSDKESGIKEARALLDDKSSKVENTYSISKSGKYSVEVEDNVGHVSKKSLRDVIGSDTIVYDENAPVITEVSGFDPDITKGNRNWYSSYPEIVYDVQDDNLKAISVTVDGKKLEDTTETGKVTVPYDKKNGLHEVTISSLDKAGNISEKSYTFYVDTTAPSYTGNTLLGTYKDRGYGLYFKEAPVVIGTGSDGEGIGVSSYKLYNKDGDLLKESAECNFEIETGEYFLSVVDELGNESAKFSLKDLCNLPNNRFVIDGKSPEISCSRPDGDVNGWFASDKEYVASISDAVGIWKASISINGVTVDSFEADKDVQDVVLSANTSKVKAGEDGSYKVTVKVEDNSGNTKEWSDTVYIDRTAPVINRFTITGDGYNEGNVINGSGEYGFFFKGGATIDVHVSDGDISSGMDKIYYRTENTNGESVSGYADISGGVATFSVPNGFKGFVYARAYDNVGNEGQENKPDGIISEDSNWHVNSSRISINLPDTKYRDNAGNNLYSSDVSISADIRDTASGLREVQWGINDTTVGTVNISKNGNISGDTAYVQSKDRNLVVDLNKSMPTSGNTNGMRIWVRTVDRAGHTSESSKVISIDKDNPVISVSYDSTEQDSIYNKTRVATVRITERNFRASDVVFDGEIGSVGEWRNAGGDDWVCNVVFSEDGNYKWSVAYTDLAGNKGNTYGSEDFIIDKTAPVMGVTYNNDNPENGNYYNETRVATVSVRDKNFDSSLVKLEGSGGLGGWSSNGDIHTSQIVFSEDGEYEFSLGLSDKAGNTGNNYSSGKFIVDKTAPVLEVSGVQDGVSYKKNTGFRVSMSDKNVDTARSSVKLVGRANGNMVVSGSLNGQTGEFSFSGFPEGLDYDDLYNLRAVIYDKAGNYREENIDFSINRYGSRYEFLTADLLGNYINKAEDVDLEETTVDRLDMNSIEIVVIRDGEVLDVDKSHIKISETGGQNGPWVYRYHIDKEVFDKDGKYQIQVYSKSAFGDENSSLKEEYSFILDTTPPEIIISGVETDGSYEGVSRRVTIEVRDLTGVESIEAKLNGEDLALSNEDGLYYATIEEDSSPQDLVVTVVDKAGNEGSENINNFLITSDVVQSMLHRTWVRWGIGAVVVFLFALIALLLKRRKDNKEQEERIAEEHAKMYRDSSSGSGSNGSNSSNENTENVDTVPMDEETEDTKGDK